MLVASASAKSMRIRATSNYTCPRLSANPAGHTNRHT